MTTETTDRSVVVLGAGGVGFWTALALSRHYRVVVYDGDSVEGTGALRLPFGTGLKVQLLAAFAWFNFGTRIEPRDWFYAGAQLEDDALCVVDATDMALDRRRKIWEDVKAQDLPIIRCSYEGRGSVIVISTGLPLAAPNTNPVGYAERPTLALSFAAGGLAAETVRYWIANGFPTISIRISVEELCSKYLSSQPVR